MSINQNQVTQIHNFFKRIKENADSANNDSYEKEYIETTESAHSAAKRMLECNRIVLENEKLKADLKEKSDVRAFRKHWSWFIMGCVGSLLTINAIFLWLIGTNKLHFNEMSYVHDVLIGNFMEIVVMAYIVVKFLFPQQNNQDKN